jgi:hypothetical protein
LKSRFAIGAVDADVAGPPHTRTEYGNAEQLRFGQPAELNRQCAVQDRDIEVALMIRHENIGSVLQVMTESGDFGSDIADPKDTPAPQPRDAVHAVAVPGKKRDDDGQKSQRDGRSDDPAVNDNGMQYSERVFDRAHNRR